MTPIRTGLIWAFAERYATMVLTLASSVIIARLLTPAEIGLFSLCAATMAISGGIREFGASEFIVKEPVLTRETLRNAFTVQLTASWGIGIIVFMCRGLLAGYYEEPRIAPLISVLCLNFLLLPFASPAAAVLNRELAFRLTFVIQFIAAVSGFACAITLAMTGFGAFSLAWSSVVSMAVQVVVITIARPGNSLLMPLWKGAGRIFSYGSYQIGARVIEMTTTNAHEFIIASSFGFASVGLFSRAKGIVDLFNTNVTTAVSRVATPTMARSLREGHSIVQDYAHMTALLSCVSWTFLSFVAVMAPEIVSVLLGGQWGAATPVMSALAVAMVPAAFFVVSSSVLSAMGQAKRKLQVTLQWCPAHLLALVIGSQISLEWTALAWFVGNVAIAFFYGRQVKLLLKTTVARMYRGTGLSAVVSVVATVALLIAAEICRSAQLPALVSLCVTFGAAALAWACAILALSHPAKAELFRAGIFIRSKLAGIVNRPIS